MRRSHCAPRLGAAAFVALSIAARASESRAQAPAGASASDDEQRRAALYQQGVDAAAGGRWDEARERFAAAVAIRESPRVLFSLAQAEEHVGQLAHADAHYRRALDAAKAAGEKDVVAATEPRLAGLEPRLPHVTIIVSGAANAAVAIDGRPIAAGTAVPVDPGTHRVVASAPGLHEAVATIALAERQSLDVPLRLEPEAAAAAPEKDAPKAPPADSAPVPHGTSTWRVVAMVGAGAGVVAAGVGGYLGVEAKSKLDESNGPGGCSGNACPQGAYQTRRDALSFATASDVAFAVGGALLAAGAALWFLAPSAQGGQGGTQVGIGPGRIVVRAAW